MILWSKAKMNSLRAVKFFCLMIFSFFVIINAWQADDAYHSHKMSYNFANGNGLVYNAGERVCASTEPLNTILVGIVFKITGHMYFSSMLLCLFFSIGAVFILFNFSCRSKGNIILAAILLILCRSFISYTTSGLENSLLFFLFSILLCIYFRFEFFDSKRIVLFAFIVSLILMARMDNALLAFPLLLFVLLRRKNMSMTTAVLYILLGLIPFISWEIFSVAYYGFPFPNTAYAKIGTSIPLSDYIKRGIKYFVGALFEDTTVLIFPLLFVIQTAMMKSFKYITVSIGIALYYMYLLYIGGDFMFGRHFTVPFFVSVFCLFASLPSWIYCTVTKKLLSSILGAKCGGGGGYNYYCDNGMYGHTVFLNEQ